MPYWSTATSCVIRSVQVDAHDAKQRTQEALGLAKWEPVDQTQCQLGLDGQVRVLARGTALAGAYWSPRLDGVLRDPQGDVASSYEGLVVLGPVGDAILSFVLRMDA